MTKSYELSEIALRIVAGLAGSAWSASASVTPDTVVQRAFEIAEAFQKKLKERGGS